MYEKICARSFCLVHAPSLPVSIFLMCFIPLSFSLFVAWWEVTCFTFSVSSCLFLPFSWCLFLSLFPSRFIFSSLSIFFFLWFPCSLFLSPSRFDFISCSLTFFFLLYLSFLLLFLFLFNLCLGTYKCKWWIIVFARPSLVTSIADCEYYYIDLICFYYWKQ